VGGKTHFTFNVFSLSLENLAVYETMWKKNIVAPDRPQITIWRMRIACWVTMATDTHTHSEYVTVTAFTLQQWLHERTSLLRYTYIICIVKLPEDTQASDGWLIDLCVCVIRVRKFVPVVLSQPEIFSTKRVLLWAHQLRPSSLKYTYSTLKVQRYLTFY
jgi:hypothetical protein